jgi:hypothetical protein
MTLTLKFKVTVNELMRPSYISDQLVYTSNVHSINRTELVSTVIYNALPILWTEGALHNQLQ